MTERIPTEELLKPDETRRIWKNVVVLSIAFMMHFTAINAAVNLQSSINVESGLGTASLAALYVGHLLSNTFATSIVIKWFGTKNVIFMGFITHMPFIVCQLYPRSYTLIPAAILLGIGSGLLWCSQATYLSVAAEAHSSLSKVPAGDLLTRFLGFFFVAFQTSQIWGNLISSLVISTANNASVTILNETMIPLLCGSNFLPTTDALEALPPQPFNKILILVCIYLVCIIGGMITLGKGLDSMKRYSSCRKTANKSMSGFSLLTATVKQLADVNQLLLIPISMLPGITEAFFFADFTSSFVSCAIGTGSVGYVMVTFGAANLVGCIVTGFLVKLFCRLPVVCSAMIIHIGVLVTLLLWRPHAGDYDVMFLIAILCGLCDSVWLMQLYGFYGVQFRGKEEAAYSNLQLWLGVGNIISFTVSSYVRTRSKICMVLCNLILGVIGYLMVEYRRHKLENSK